MTENTLKQTARATRDLNLASSQFEELFQDYPVSSDILGVALPITTDAVTNIVRFPKSVLYCSNIEAQALLAPKGAATGLDISMDQVDTNGIELNLQVPAQADARFNFTIDAEPVGFFIEAAFTVVDVSGANELLVGFRKSAAFAKARSSYTDYAMIGLIRTDIKLATNLNNAGEVLTDTTDNGTDAETLVLRVEVTTDGKVSYKLAKTAALLASGGLVTPTVTLDYKFDTGDVVVPCIRQIQHGDLSGDIIMTSLKCGYLN